MIALNIKLAWIPRDFLNSRTGIPYSRLISLALPDVTFFLIFLLSEKYFQKNHKFSLKNLFIWKRDEFERGCRGLLVETMLIRKYLIDSIRNVLWDIPELPGTRAILEKRALLRGNFGLIRLNIESSVWSVNPWKLNQIIDWNSYYTF